MATNHDEAQNRSVQVTGPASMMETTGDDFIFSLATVADSFTPWGRAPKTRDRELRQFWPTEPILASALYSVVIRNAAFSWTLDGSPLTVKATQNMLQGADFGKGVRHMI
ncbi:hypothetical protein LCGC14_0964960, partial [marine sediment metagenome]